MNDIKQKTITVGPPPNNDVFDDNVRDRPDYSIAKAVSYEVNYVP